MNPILIDGRAGAKAYLDQPCIRIGKGSECEVRMADSFLSSVHAELRLINGDWFIYNTSTTSHFSVDDTSLLPGRGILLNDGADIRLSAATHLTYSENDVEMITALLPGKNASDGESVPDPAQGAAGSDEPSDSLPDSSQSEELKSDRKRPARKGFAVLCVLVLLISSGTAAWFFLSDRRSEKAKEVDQAIEEIAAVTLDSQETISAIMENYNSLTEEEKASLRNAEILFTAEETLRILQIDNAIETIQNDLSNASNSDFQHIRSQYDQISEERRDEVRNYSILEELYGKWLEMVQDHVLGCLAEVLENVSTPAWDTPLDDLITAISDADLGVMKLGKKTDDNSGYYYEIGKVKDYSPSVLFQYNDSFDEISYCFLKFEKRKDAAKVVSYLKNRDIFISIEEIPTLVDEVRYYSLPDGSSLVPFSDGIFIFSPTHAFSKDPPSYSNLMEYYAFSIVQLTDARRTSTEIIRSR